jgi:endonuclease YncB( thermonuclease family)
MASVPARLPLALALAVLLSPALVTAQAADCTGFDSQIWAQSVFETDPVTYATLDPDGNGLACEELDPDAAPASWTTEVPAGAEPVELTGVTDGDTIRALVNRVDEPVGLILIDAPEMGEPTTAPACYGPEATAYLTWLLSLGGDLSLETDASDRDEFGRLLRYAWLDFGDGEVYLVNEVLARSGSAVHANFSSNVRYEEQIREAVRFARDHGYGLWSACYTDDDGDPNDVTADVTALEEGVPAPVTQPEPDESVGDDAVVDGPVQEDYPFTAAIRGENIALRVEPAADTEILAYLQRGDRIRVTGVMTAADGDVFSPVEVIATGEAGWVRELTIDPRSLPSREHLPVVEVNAPDPSEQPRRNQNRRARSEADVVAVDVPAEGDNGRGEDTDAPAEGETGANE